MTPYLGQDVALLGQLLNHIEVICVGHVQQRHLPTCGAQGLEGEQR